MSNQENCQLCPPGQKMPWYARIWQNFLIGFLPRKIKRMIFLACIFAYVTDMETPSDETIHKLNQLLHLSNDDEAIKFPLVIRHAIWKSLEEPIQLDDGTMVMDIRQTVRENKPNIMNQIINSFINCAPTWVKYDSRLVLENDLHVMFNRFAY